MSDKINMYGLSLEELEEQMEKLGQKKFRAKQLYSWLYRFNVDSFDDMTDISKSFREVLKERYTLTLPKIYTKQMSDDGTIKLLLELEDGHKVETVLMHYFYGDSVCVSSEVGCNMGCKFCASGLLKKVRGLDASEMMGQVLIINQLLRPLKRKVTHVVVMGTGEPFDNYDNVMSFIKAVNSQFGLDIGARHITVSTAGVVPGILKYGKEGLQINLAISLHAPLDEVRNKLMPINQAYPLDQVMAAVDQYFADSNRQVTFEYIMIKDLNDTDECLKALIDLIKPRHGFVNLIPYNEVMENDFRRSSNNRVHKFHDALLKAGIKSTIRKEFGSDIDAACGQLRARYEHK
ncbi:MAG: 23S rRNA (adenine(2503)-C(2))-methyltransferase RlmN [Bacilli bacterium]|nr:23S rRNA (adenine(2503)-C(2))-methyltransferase RlmN [Bacilli bacterium]